MAGKLGDQGAIVRYALTADYAEIRLGEGAEWLGCGAGDAHLIKPAA